MPMTTPTNGASSVSIDAASIDDLFAQFGLADATAGDHSAPGAPGAVATTPAAMTQRRSAPVTPRSPAVVPNIDAISGEIRRLAHEQTGLVGTLKTKLFGDAMKRQQLATLATRIHVLNIGEEIKLVLFLLGAVRLAAFESVTTAIDEMDRQVAMFEPGSPADVVGRQMIQFNMEYMMSLANQVTQVGEGQSLTAAGLDR